MLSCKLLSNLLTTVGLEKVSYFSFFVSQEFILLIIITIMIITSKCFILVASTYESVLMKKFLRGRTETGRPLTAEV